jgi:aromatic-L-amino-acid/L-tryptophan decarboxylase
MCVVATIGTTSSTAVDPVNQIADYCNKENIWLHVDAAYAGVTASIPEMENFFNGWEKADSIVSNPHKWLFVPIDLSTLFVKKPEVLKRAFSLIPEYLKSSEDSLVENYMDYGIQLGRRFRALKLWFVIRYFGITGLKNRIASHISIAKQLAGWVEQSADFELLAPVNFSTVCFRAVLNGKSENELNEINEKLLSKINSTGEFFLTHTKLNGKFTIRLVVSGIRQELKHAEQAWQLVNKSLKEII